MRLSGRKPAGVEVGTDPVAAEIKQPSMSLHGDLTYRWVGGCRYVEALSSAGSRMGRMLDAGVSISHLMHKLCEAGHGARAFALI